VSPVAVARAVSAGRLGLGLVMMASPRLAMSRWVGEAESRRPTMDLVTRAFGAREVLLGFLALHVADRPGVGKRTIGALALCDLTDLTATIVRRESLPKAAVPMMVAVAGGAFASQLWASRELP
jgi:hypothetical protein